MLLKQLKTLSLCVYAGMNIATIAEKMNINPRLQVMYFYCNICQLVS